MREKRFDKFFMDPDSTFLRRFSVLEKRFLPAYVWQTDMLTLWRERILFVICFIAVVLGPIALIPSVILSFAESRWDVIILDTFAYAMAVVILTGRRFSLNIRSWCTWLVLYGLGTGLLFMLGSVGAGYIWLFGASVMAGALIGLRASVIALLMNLLTMVLVALFITYGHPSWVADPIHSTQRWLVMSVNFMLPNMFVTLTTALMLGGLQKALSKEMDMIKSVRESEERLRTAFQTSPDAITINRLADGAYVDVNHGFTTMMGYDRAEVIGHTINDLKIWVNDETSQAFLKELKDTGGVNNREVPFMSKGGVSRTGLVSASLFDYEGGPYVLSVIRDITALKTTELQLQQARKMEAIGILAGGIAHDFNNILQVIGGYIQLLMMKMNQDNPDQAKLAEVEKAVEHAAQLVRQLLTFSRKAEAKNVTLDLNAEIQSVARILKRTLPRMIDIHLHLGRDLDPINADPVQIEQILLNLATNAADAMPDGGTLMIASENITPTDEYLNTHVGARTGKHVLLSVSDTGVGIPKDVIDHIFEPFFTTKEFGKGTGLGLASVYGIVKSYNGYISCYSEVGQGTTFRLYLPAADVPAAGEAEKTPKIDRPKGGDETILLVDDEEAIRSFASEVLEGFGYRVLTGASGEEALEIAGAGNQTIALVILDLGMPGMGGYKCLQEIRKLNPQIKILIASGYAMNGQMEKSLEMGATGYIGKPYQISKLLSTVREILDGKS